MQSKNQQSTLQNCLLLRAAASKKIVCRRSVVIIPKFFRELVQQPQFLLHPRDGIVEIHLAVALDEIDL